MSKQNEKEKKLKFCVYCGAKLEKGKTYCPECGKLVIKIIPSDDKAQKQKEEHMTQIREKKVIARKCSGCGSIITSEILEQCPICNTKLEKIPKQDTLSEPSVARTGFIFTNKKLVPEQKFIMKKDAWNFKEGLSVFFNCLMAYFVIRFLITMLQIFPFDAPSTTEVNIFTLILDQIPEIIFGVYPIWYIYSKKHNISKLSLSYKLKTLLFSIIIGITAGIILLVLNYFSDFFIELIYNAGIDFIDILTYIAEVNQIVIDADLIWLIFLMILFSLGVISTEIVFRGVLHNTLRERYGSNISGRITVIILVALINSGIFLLFSIPIGIYFFLINFIEFIIYGIIYEIKNSLYTTIIASIFYNLLLILILVFL